MFNYRDDYEALMERCEVLEQENEELIRKLMKRVVEADGAYSDEAQRLKSSLRQYSVKKNKDKKKRLHSVLIAFRCDDCKRLSPSFVPYRGGVKLTHGWRAFSVIVHGAMVMRYVCPDCFPRIKQWFDFWVYEKEIDDEDIVNKGG